MPQLSGYILANTSKQVLSLDDLVSAEPLLNGDSLKFVRPRPNAKQWDELSLTTRFPLGNETDYSPTQTFKYKVWFIRGFSKVIVLAEWKRVADYVTQKFLRTFCMPRLRAVNVAVQSLVSHCEAEDTEFLVTALTGRHALNAPNASSNVKSISLYGDDVTNSAVYRSFGHTFNFQTCGLGRRLFDGVPRLTPNEEGEIVRIRSDGYVIANTSSVRKANEFINAMSFVLQPAWLEPWVPFSEAS